MTANKRPKEKNKQFEHEGELKKDRQKTDDFQKDDFWEYCDNCGQHLIVRKCELICPKCGFFHSCSEP